MQNLIFRKIKSIGKDEKRRIGEFTAMITITLVFVALSRLEGRLFDLSKALSRNQDYLNSLVYFGLININVVLILILGFLLFRNIVKLVIDRRRGVIGSHLRTRLVVALVFFAVAPTALLFYISTRFLTESFDTWFSTRVEETMHKTREAGALVYDRDQRRLANLARIALQRIDVIYVENLLNETHDFVINAQKLRGFSREYKVSSVKVYDKKSVLLWSSDQSSLLDKTKEQKFVSQALQRFNESSSLISRAVIDAEEGRDLVRGVAPIIGRYSVSPLGVVVVEERFDTQILQSVETIIQEFSGLKPGAELIRLSYVILLVLMVVIIVFSATWLGFYVARGIIAPIQRLADATRAVAVGNYDIKLEVSSDDETGQLTRAFNSMTNDLRVQSQQVQAFTAELKRANKELDDRRKYMEVILQNISAGVIAVDSEGFITSINPAAKKLLSLEDALLVGKKIDLTLDPALLNHFWAPIFERIQFGSFSGEIDLNEIGRPLTLLADAAKILDEENRDRGVVVVFDDASDQVKVQRVAAWREVARRIAHEIKNPITPIKISAQRLLRKFGENFQGRDHQVFVACIETIISEVDALRDLVNEFSKFSRLPTVKTKPENINQLLKDVLALFVMSYPHVDFRVELMEENVPLVAIDREQMVRVFTNIISNSIAAIESTGFKGVIVMKTFLMDDFNLIRVEVCDNGCGIPDALKQRVLEPYFSTKREGTGLGLAIVHQIVTDHGGYLRILDNPGGGAVVAIELPLNVPSGVK